MGNLPITDLVHVVLVPAPLAGTTTPTNIMADSKTI
jgi:hypothetical protein